MAAFVPVSAVRDYLGQTSTTGRYSDANLGSNIRAASGFLQKTTGRQFEQQDATLKTFSTYNRAIVHIPDLRSVDSLTLDGSALEANETYHLLPDRRSSGIFTAVQFRIPDTTWNHAWYLADSQWFDKGLDLRKWSGYTSEANNLLITGDWGYLTGSEPSMPEELLHATKILAAWYTLRPDSVLANISVSPDGVVSQYGQLPPEVVSFLAEWSLGEQATAI